MKIKLALIVCIISISGCKNVDIGVKEKSPTSSLQPAPPLTPKDVKTVLTSNDPGTIYFEHITMHDGQPERLRGLAFLPSSSATTSAFDIRFPSQMVFSGVPLFSPGFRNVTYVSSDSMGQSAILRTDISDIGTKVVKVLDSVPVAYSSSYNGQWMAWVDQAGLAYVMSSSAKKPMKIDLGGAFATDVQVDRIGTFALVTSLASAHDDPTQATIHKILLGETTLQTIPVSGLTSTPVLSPDGRAWASIVKASDGTPSVNIARGSESGAVSALTMDAEVSAIFDLNWVDTNQLLYVRALKSGVRQVLLANVDSGSAEVVSTVGLPDGLSDGVICPLMFDGEIYFANYSGAEFSIYKAIRQNDEWTPVLFASTGHRADGYICPKASLKVTAP